MPLIVGRKVGFLGCEPETPPHPSLQCQIIELEKQLCTRMEVLSLGLGVDGGSKLHKLDEDPTGLKV